MSVSTEQLKTILARVAKLSKQHKTIVKKYKDALDKEKESAQALKQAYEEKFQVLQQQLQTAQAGGGGGGFQPAATIISNANEQPKDSTYLEVQVNALKEELAKVGRLKVQADSEIAGLKEELQMYEEIKQGVSSKDAELQKAIREIKKLRAKITDLNSTVEEKDSNIESMKKDFEEKNKEQEEVIKTKQEEINDWLQTVNEMQDKIDHLTDISEMYDVVTLKTRIQEIKIQVLTLEPGSPLEDCQKLLEEIVEIERQTDRSEKDLSHKLANFQNDLGELEAKLKNQLVSEQLA